MPLLAITIDCEAVAPTLTVPKLTDVGVTEISGVAVLPDPPTIGFPVTPMQAAEPKVAKVTIRQAKVRTAEKTA